MVPCNHKGLQQCIFRKIERNRRFGFKVFHIIGRFNGKRCQSGQIRNSGEIGNVTEINLLNIPNPTEFFLSDDSVAAVIAFYRAVQTSHNRVAELLIREHGTELLLNIRQIVLGNNRLDFRRGIHSQSCTCYKVSFLRIGDKVNRILIQRVGEFAGAAVIQLFLTAAL